MEKAKETHSTSRAREKEREKPQQNCEGCEGENGRTVSKRPGVGNGCWGMGENIFMLFTNRTLCFPSQSLLSPSHSIFTLSQTILVHGHDRDGCWGKKRKKRKYRERFGVKSLLNLRAIVYAATN
jgi:hypothetical protein